ncbi:MAG: MnmC family methyltransferase, partial [Aquificaceae bacterium]|nr:MnmC family methyltransferase [Aquificaceae bacterium]
MDLGALVEDFVLKKKLSLPKESIKAILTDLVAWTKPSVEGAGIARTEKGDFTLLSPKYGEPYHSLSAGAVGECLEKFLLPSRLLQKAEKQKRVSLLDVGFGLGYNVAVAIKKIRDVNPRAEIEILSLEKELPQEVPPLPGEYRAIHERLWNRLPEFEDGGVSFKLLLGDARERIREVEGFFDAVFHDAFSPYRNSEMWSLEFLSHLKRLMGGESIWVSYTSALPVRKALRMLGFKLSSTRSVGRKRGGTKACLVGEDGIGQVESSKLETSPYALPFLDPTLKEEGIQI